MKILIIEDEQPNFIRLNKQLTDIDPSYTIEGPLTSQTAVRKYFEEGGNPDLVISDIRLSDGLVFDALDYVDCKSRIIFTTAYSEYAVKAFQYNSIHYLLKPIVASELKEAIDKAFMRMPENLADIRQLADILSASTTRKRFLVPWRDGFEIIKTDEVCYLSHDYGTLRLYLANGASFPLDMTIEECETQLSSEMFFRANRQYIVNINAIKKLISFWDRKIKIVLTNFPDVEILVSRDKSKALRQWLDR
ncbi:MAG: LytTR family DNA-binding domain-containing protein [Paramuribaculum sp.]|nr:LytTR family DNA-binding domain-containing protein [Paramuribaculum sp.]